MPRDSVTDDEGSLTQRSFVGRHSRPGQPAERDALNERRLYTAGIFEEIGPLDLAARFEVLPRAMSIVRVSDGMIRVMNDDCLRLLGRSHADCVGKTPDEIFLWVDPTDGDRFVGELKKRAEVTDMEARFRRADGVPVPILISGRLFDVPGEQLVLCVAQDISERKQIEAAMSRSEEHYRALVTVMDEGAIFVNGDGVITSVNRSAESILGFPASDLLGCPLEARVAMGRHVRADGTPLPVDDHPVVAALRTGEPQPCRVMGVHRRDGSLAWISVNTQALVLEGESRPHGAFSTFRDITAELAAHEELRNREADLERLLAERESNLALVKGSLASAVRIVNEMVEMRDPYTGGHQRRVSELATRIGQAMKMTAAQVEEIRVAALIHDVGKMAVPVEILSKPGRLSDLEFSLVKFHAEAGYRIVSSAQAPGDTAEIVRQHHERCDGSGYPRGLRSGALLPAAKVLMVADVVEAMTTHRPYRAALGLDAALDEIGGGAGTRYDADVCRACTDVLQAQGFSFSES